MDISCLALSLPGGIHPRTSENAPSLLSSTLRLLQVLSRHELDKLPIPLRWVPCYSLWVVIHLTPKGASTMEWVAPQHEVIDLNCEVSSYANAEL